MCKKSSSTTQTNAPPQYIQDAQKRAIGQAEQLSQRPLQQYAGPMLAGFTPAQMASFGTVNGMQGMIDPYINAGTQYTQAATNSIANQTPLLSNPATAGLADTAYGTFTGGPQNIASGAMGLTPQFANSVNAATGQYMSPYTQDVVNATMAQMNNQDQQQQNQLVGNAVSAGAWGGDRAGVAQAVLGGQQALAKDQTLAQLYSQGYNQAQQTALGTLGQGLNTIGQQNQQALGFGSAAQQAYAQQLQAAQQAASQQGLLNLYAGQQMGSLGSMAQGDTLNAANAQMGIGNAQQQQAQQQLNIPYQQFEQAQAYPYQQLQFMDSIINGTAGLAGGTQRLTQPAGSLLSQLTGAGIALGGTGAFGDSGWLTGSNGLFNDVSQWFARDGGAIGEFDNGGAVAPPTGGMTPIEYLMLRNRQHLFDDPLFEQQQSPQPPAYAGGGDPARIAARDARRAARQQDRGPGGGGHDGGGGGGGGGPSPVPTPTPTPTPIPGPVPGPNTMFPPQFNGVNVSNILRTPTPQTFPTVPPLTLGQNAQGPFGINPVSNYSPPNPALAPSWSTPGLTPPPATHARGGYIRGYPMGGPVAPAMGGSGFGTQASGMTGSGGWGTNDFMNLGINGAGVFAPMGYGFGLGALKGIGEDAMNNWGSGEAAIQPNNGKTGLLNPKSTSLGERAYWSARNMITDLFGGDAGPASDAPTSGPGVTNTSMMHAGSMASPMSGGQMAMQPGSMDPFGGATGDIAGNSGPGFFSGLNPFSGGSLPSTVSGDVGPGGLEADNPSNSQEQAQKGKAGGGSIFGGFTPRHYDDGGDTSDDSWRTQQFAMMHGDAPGAFIPGAHAMDAATASPAGVNPWMSAFGAAGNAISGIPHAIGSMLPHSNDPWARAIGLGSAPQPRTPPASFLTPHAPTARMPTFTISDKGVSTGSANAPPTSGSGFNLTDPPPDLSVPSSELTDDKLPSTGRDATAPGPSDFNTWMAGLATNPHLAMIAMGLGMMGSKGNFGQAISEGGMDALKVVMAQKENADNQDYRKQEIALRSQQLENELKVHADELHERQDEFKGVSGSTSAEIASRQALANQEHAARLDEIKLELTRGQSDYHSMFDSMLRSYDSLNGSGQTPTDDDGKVIPPAKWASDQLASLGLKPPKDTSSGTPATSVKPSTPGAGPPKDTSKLPKVKTMEEYRQYHNQYVMTPAGPKWAP